MRKKGKEGGEARRATERKINKVFFKVAVK